MDEGYVKLWRKSLNSTVFANSKLWMFWCWCIMKATWKPMTTLVGFQKIDLLPGQFIFGRIKAAEEIPLSETTIRTCIKTLIKLENMTIKTTNKFSIITICNWDTYQSTESENDQQNDQQTTNKRPTNDHKQEVKELKEGKEEKKKDNILLVETTFDLFWSIYPKKTGKKPSLKKWSTIVRSQEDADKLTIALQNQIRLKYISPDKKYCPNLLTWLNQERWNDEIVEERKCNKCGTISTFYLDDDIKCDCGGIYEQYHREGKSKWTK